MLVTCGCGVSVMLKYEFVQSLLAAQPSKDQTTYFQPIIGTISLIPHESMIRGC